MNITIGPWIIPAALTAACVLMLCRPYQKQGDYDFGFIFRLAWLIPVGFIWAVYFAALLIFK